MACGFTRRAALALPLLGLAGPGRAAASWPDHPIRMVVGFAPGGGADITARIMSPLIGQALGQTIVVENRSGASGIIACEYVARAAPDGYTLLTAPSSFTISTSLFSKLPFDPERSFTPISLFTTGSNVLIVSPDFPVHSVEDLIRLARDKPGQLSYASTGNVSAQTMAAELFKAMTGTDIVGIQYRGGGPAMVDVASGQVPIMFANMTSASGQIRSGAVRAIAVSGTQRTAQYPDLPTIAEAGVPGYAVDNWDGLIGPAGLPAEIVGRLHDIVVRELQTAEVKARLAALGVEPAGSTPETFRVLIHEEIGKWAGVVKQTGVHVE